MLPIIGIDEFGETKVIYLLRKIKAPYGHFYIIGHKYNIVLKALEKNWQRIVLSKYKEFHKPPPPSSLVISSEPQK